MPFTILSAEGFEVDNSIGELQTRYSLPSGYSVGPIATVGSDPAIARVPGSSYVEYNGNPMSQRIGYAPGRLVGTFAEAFASYRTISIAFAVRGNPSGTTYHFKGLMDTSLGSVGFGIRTDGSSGGRFLAYSYPGGAATTVPYSIFPAVAADAWGQVEFIYIANTLGGRQGIVRVYYQDILVLESSFTLATSALSAQDLQCVLIGGGYNSGTVARRSPYSHEDDIIIAFGTDPDERIGATYISALPATADVSTTNWTSSDGTTPLANNVNKAAVTVATPFIETSSVGDEAIFSSSSSLPNDGRIVRAVTVQGAGQSNSDLASAQLVVNSTLVDQPYSLGLGTQTALNAGYGADLPQPNNWLHTDPADSQDWTITKVNNLQFGVRRIS